MGLRAKILCGFLILSAMLLVAGGWSIREVAVMGGSVQTLLDDNYKSINAGRAMVEALEREDSGVLLLLLGSRERGTSILLGADGMFQEAFAVAANNVTVPGEREQIDEIDSRYRAYREMWMKATSEPMREGDIAWYSTEVHYAFLEAKASVVNLIAMNDRMLYQTASDLKGRAHRAIMPGVIAIIAALAFSLIFNFFVHLYVVNPILGITRAIRKFIETREPFQFQVETKDELSQLASSLQDLVAQIRAGREPR